MHYDFQWDTLLRAWPYLLQGFQTTAMLVVVAMVLGIGIGTVLAVLRLFGPRPVAAVVAGYVNLFRSIPLVLTLFWFFFLVPFLLRWVTGDDTLMVGPIGTAICALVLAESAYYCEIIRAGIGSVRNGQMHAGMALGMSRFQVLRHVVVPQAFRNMAPSLVNQTIALLKDTSLVYVVSLNDFLGAATKVGQRDGTLVEMYLFVAVVYLALCSAGVWMVGHLERRATLKATT
jgi:glutamate/aspartate transport system permease protein